MFVIFLALFFLTLGCAFIEPYFFIGYLMSIAIAGLYQAIFMANAGGAWDNAKKVVECNLKQKGTDLHAATVVGDTVGDPFKDTSSVALNPVINLRACLACWPSKSPRFFATMIREWSWPSPSLLWFSVASPFGIPFTGCGLAILKKNPN